MLAHVRVHVHGTSVCVHTFKGACAWCITDKCKMFDGDKPYLQLSSLGGQIGSEYLFLRY